MAIIKSVAYSGDSRTSTNNGSIEINEGTGEIIIRKGAKVATRIDSQGFTFSPPSGVRQIHIGSNPSNVSDVGVYVTKPGVDVITALGG